MVTSVYRIPTHCDKQTLIYLSTIMKFTSYTAAAILAFALARAGAVPSPQETDAVAVDPAAPPPEEPVYYPEETEDGNIEKRGDHDGAYHKHFRGRPNSGHGPMPDEDGDIEKRDDKYTRKIDGTARPYGGHRFGGSDPDLHGPMPDEDSIDLTPFFDHPDPTIRAIATKVKRAPLQYTNINGVNMLQLPGVHWWETLGWDERSQVGGNPNTRTWQDPKVDNRFGAGLKREAGPEPGSAGGKGGSGGHGMGDGQGEGHGGPPGGMGDGQGKGQDNPRGGAGGGQGKGQGNSQGGTGGGQGKDGKPGGMEGGHGNGGQGGQWGGQGGQGGHGHGPMAEEQ